MQLHQVIIIGSGFGGQAAAVNLQRKGITDFILLERRSFMGGTWCQNTYPGAQVDVQSPLYSLSFEPYPWTRMFAKQAELKEYTHHVIDKYGIRKKTETNANVEKIQWEETAKKWHIQCSDGRQFQSQFIINASGGLSTPVIPDFKGRATFQGKQFHTNQWNHDFDYKGKRVAIVGSGASAIQVIPAIAPAVEHLHVFQRTPHWIMPRPDMDFPKFIQGLLKNKFFYNFVRNFIYWALETRILAFKYSERLAKFLGERKAKKLLKKQVKDETLRERLTPNYTIGCKRILVSNILYPALQRENVTLKFKEQGIQEINATGILTQDGEQVDLDAIIYATGFDATDNAVPYPVIGKNNLSLAEYWSEYPRAYLGTTMPNFPNLFIVLGPNTGIGHTSAIVMIEAQMEYIIRAIQHTIRQEKQVIEVREEAENKYTQMIHKEMVGTVWENGGCDSWYKSKSGKIIAIFPGFSFVYKRWAKRFKVGDHLVG